jgi:hypothetical protein
VKHRGHDNMASVPLGISDDFDDVDIFCLDFEEYPI